MLAPFLKDAPVCVSGSSHAGASAEPGHSPSSGAALGVGLESCTGREKLKEVAEQSWDPLAHGVGGSGSAGSAPVAKQVWCFEASSTPGLIPMSCGLHRVPGLCLSLCWAWGTRAALVLGSCCCSSLLPSLLHRVPLFVQVSQGSIVSLQLPKGGHGGYSRSPLGLAGDPSLPAGCCLPQPWDVP